MREIHFLSICPLEFSMRQYVLRFYILQDGASTGPGMFWKVLEFEEFPGKSCDLLIFMKNPGKVLEFYKIFVL